jgi:hypothetical protein
MALPGRCNRQTISIAGRLPRCVADGGSLAIAAIYHPHTGGRTRPARRRASGLLAAFARRVRGLPPSAGSTRGRIAFKVMVMDNDVVYPLRAKTTIGLMHTFPKLRMLRTEASSSLSYGVR